MAKKKSYLEIIEEAQRNTAQRQAEGRINFKEDSRNTRVQYSLPHYQGRSETDKTYKWEKELLGPIKAKGVRSYNDKFKVWAEQQGMLPGQADEYRKYLDFQEDSQWQEPQTNKDGSIKQGQSLNYARGAYIVGNEMPDLIKRSQERKATDYAFKGQRAVEKQLEQQKAQEEAQKIQSQKDAGVKAYKEDKDDRPAYAKFIDRFLLPISKGMSEVVAPGNNERMIQNDLMDGELDNPVNQASLIDRGTETKILEGAGTIAGYVAPYGQGYKVADLALNKLPKLAGALTNPYANRAVRGGLAGLGAESGLAATNELFNSEAKDAQDYALQIGLGVAGGAVLDPALYGVGQGIKKGAEKAAQGLVPDSVPYTPEGFQQGLEDAFAPRGNVSNVLADPVPTMPKPFESRYNLTSQQPVTGNLDNFTTTDIPGVETPAVLDDLFNFAQSGGKPQARGTTPKVANPARYAKEDIGNMADTTLNRVNQLDGNRNQRVLEVMQDMKANRNLTPEQNEALTQAQQVWEQRQVREDAFVEQELAPYYDSQQNQVNIEQQWGTTVKQAKQEAQRIKQQFGKISVPSGRGDDIVDQIPPQFRANKNELAYDVYKMADEMGMTPEELVQYLKQIDNDSKLRKMDLGTDDGLRIKEDDWDGLTMAARRKFAETDEGRSLDQLFVDSLEAGKPTDVDALYAANRGENDPATFDELIKLAQMETNSKPIEPDLKSLLRNDPRVAEQVQALNNLGGAQPRTAPVPEQQADLDKILQTLSEGDTSKWLDESYGNVQPSEATKSQYAKAFAWVPEEMTHRDILLDDLAKAYNLQYEPTTMSHSLNAYSANAAKKASGETLDGVGDKLEALINGQPQISLTTTNRRLGTVGVDFENTSPEIVFNRDMLTKIDNKTMSRFINWKTWQSEGSTIDLSRPAKSWKINDNPKVTNTAEAVGRPGKPSYLWIKHDNPNFEKELAIVKGMSEKHGIPYRIIEAGESGKEVLKSNTKLQQAANTFQNTQGNPNTGSLDEMLSFLEGNNGTRTIPNAPTPGLGQNVDEVLKRFENVNNSQAVDSTLDNLNTTIKPSASSTPEVGGSKFLMRLDSQQHAPTDGSTLIETDPTVTTTSPIDMISNPLKRSASKHYKNYVNRNHEAKVAEVQILENAGLKEEAKRVNKYGSDFDKAVGNELAAGSAAKNLVERHSAALEEAVKPLGKETGKQMAEAMDYQLARNLDWIRTNVDPDYELPNGWDWGRVNSVINTGIGDKYKPFTDAMYAYNQEVRDVMLDYGMITKEVYEMLGQNPYYVPMSRDISQLLDNIDVGMSQRTGNRRRGAGPGIIYSLKGGDADTFIKNPLDTLVERTFTMYQNAMRNDTAQQALRLAEIDNGSLGLIKEISQKQYKEGGGLMVLQDGKRRYVRLQQDLQKMLDENQSALDLGKLGKATQLFAGLKTRSLEYQSAAIIRDLGQAYGTSQITNPIRYTTEFFRSLGNKRMDAKQAGAYFDRAHNDHTGGVDPKKLLEEYQRRTGNVKSFKVNDKQSWKDFGAAIKRTIDKVDVARRLGQVSDEIPRDIEVRETERLFMKKHGAEMENLNQQLNDLNQQIEAAQGLPDFDPQSSGVDDLIMQRDGIESQLRQFKQNLRREQVYRGRDVMDYSRSGGGAAAKNIRQWVIFANTTTQSKDKVIRSFIERPGATTAKMVGLVGPMVAWQQMNHDSMDAQETEVYNNLPDYMKQYNYVFVNGGDVYAVPKLHELALVTNPIEAALKGEDQNEAMRLLVKELVPYQGGNFAQGLVPNADGSMTPTQNMQVPSLVFSPGVDAIANKKLGFNQKPISFGGYYQGADAEANDWTLDVFKDLMGNNPGADKAQYLIEQYLGDYGKYGNQAANAAFGQNEDRVEEALRYLNPLQDRIFLKDGKGPLGIPFRTPAQETKK
jgi:hypothetical protein